ncbi:helix-turn-helix domain-containing protein [Hamadaea sp. NPDC050747]|uniref:helix-turn-helix domain-containing protein n=1 Tax=Hamadaea sp. NPDC050747 TaxID=3155789 RepID=UPI0033E3625A
MDARTMRALAHPTRLALLEVLNLHPSLTATEASELIGVSPTNCAFHLRTLGRYGFVEEIETGPGRRRPWRVKQADIRFSDTDGEAATALADVMLDHWLTRIRTVQGRRHSLPARWQEVLGGSQTIVYATPDETRQLVDDVRAVLSRYNERAQDPDERPDGAEPVELLVFTQLFDALSS